MINDLLLENIDEQRYLNIKEWVGVIGMSESLMKEVRKHDVSIIALTPSTIETEMTIELGMLEKGSENMLQPEDFGELIVAGLKLPRRAMLKSAALWTTNP